MRCLWRRRLLAGVVLVWSALVGLGFHAMFSHATTSGDMHDAPLRWPAGTQLSRGSSFTVVMFVHPDCPCSRASLHELAAITVGSSAKVDIVVAGPDVEGDLWEDAGGIAGATRFIDDGREAARFGALTSGHTVVYDRDGVTAPVHLRETRLERRHFGSVEPSPVAAAQHPQQTILFLCPEHGPRREGTAG